MDACLDDLQGVRYAIQNLRTKENPWNINQGASLHEETYVSKYYLVSNHTDP